METAMNSSTQSIAFDRAVGPALRQLFLADVAEAAVRFTADLAISTRIEELANKSTEGKLTDEEREEYQGYIRGNKFIAIIQRQLRRHSRPA
jgi:hypothetical protein